MYAIALLSGAVAALAYVAHVVAQHTIRIVEARRLLPHWDLATHLGHGWQDYHLIATGRIPQLLWDLWLQGYWPPLFSLYQVPFYLALGGTMSAGLWSALVTFVLVGTIGCILLWRQWTIGALLPASVYLALLMSSPYLLAYGSVTMTEMPGALAQLIVLLAYDSYRRQPGPRAARAFAISLVVLFFTKYNYFVLLAVPLALHEWLERTAGLSRAERLAGVWRWTHGLLTSPTALFVGVYVVALTVVVGSGGFNLHVLGRRISVHSIGNSGHVVLYLLLARLWYLHRRGRIDWARITASDPRVRPLLIWFVLPVVIWMASPYPNHIRDFVNLVFNRSYEGASIGPGAATYLDALRKTYFYSEWIFAAVAVVFAAAAVGYRRQPPVVQCLIVAVPLQFLAIGLHPTRFPRFLLLTVVLLCLAASSEIGRWLSTVRPGRIAAGVLAPFVLASGVVAAGRVVNEGRFLEIAFEHYTGNDTLRAAIDSVRGDLRPSDRLAVVGQSNELSPALFRWELGPPSGVACFPFEIAGARGAPLALATRVLLLMPLDASSVSVDATSDYAAQRQAVVEQADRGELVLRRRLAIPDLQVELQIYDRTSAPGREAPCQ